MVLNLDWTPVPQGLVQGLQGPYSDQTQLPEDMEKNMALLCHFFNKRIHINDAFIIRMLTISFLYSRDGGVVVVGLLVGVGLLCGLEVVVVVLLFC